MSVLQIICGIFMLLACVCIISFVMMQESKQSNGLSALNGSSSDMMMNRNVGNTKEAFYAKLTKILAIVFFALAVILNLLTRFAA